MFEKYLDCVENISLEIGVFDFQLIMVPITVCGVLDEQLSRQRQGDRGI